MNMTQKFAAYDANGNITGFYDDEHSPVPAGVNAIALSDTDWQAALSGGGYSVIKGKLVSPTAAIILAGAQAQQNSKVQSSYDSAIAQTAVSFTTAAGVTGSFQADSNSVSNLQASIAAYSATQTVPTGFYWVAADNSQVPFGFLDLIGLANSMMTTGWAAFQKLQTLKSEVRAATTLAAVQAVVW